MALLTALPRLVAEELAQLRVFVTALQREQQSLVDGHLDNLLPLAEEKSRIAASLGSLAEQRNKALAAAGLAADKTGMMDWLTSQPKSAASRAEWDNLLELAAEARRLNELNGKLIATRMQHNQQALAVLHAAVNRAMMYGPDGQQHTSGFGRHLGTA